MIDTFHARQSAGVGCARLIKLPAGNGRHCNSANGLAGAYHRAMHYRVAANLPISRKFAAVLAVIFVSNARALDRR
jgi:hypothetical protein